GHPLWQRFNSLYVLLPLFLCCVGLLVWGLWPKHVSSAEELYQAGAGLMTSDDFSTWEQARDEYFDPLERLYPDQPHKEEVARFQQEIEGRAALRRALRRAKLGPMSEAERFYQHGLRLCQEGNIKEARSIRHNVVVAFSGAESEGRWVRLCEQGLTELD